MLAERGQLALEQGHVCLLNATVLGTETLKNLTLPGVGAFTIVDKQRVAGADVPPPCLLAVRFLNRWLLLQMNVGRSDVSV